MEILEFADYLNGEVNVRCRVESADDRLEPQALQWRNERHRQPNLLRSVTICEDGLECMQRRRQRVHRVRTVSRVSRR